jgi:hypothetical protein
MKRATIMAVAVLLAGCATQGVTSTTVVTTSTTTVPTTTTTTAASTATVSTTTTTVETTTTTSSPVGELLVIGDFGSGGSAEYAVADAMRSWSQTHDVAAILTTGDDLYTSDVQKAWTTPFGWVSEADIPVWATWGNHDNQRPKAVNSAFGYPPRWWVRQWGRVEVIGVDSTDVGSAEQEQWLKATLSVAASPVIVAEHYPAYSCSYHGDSTAVRKNWAPLFGQAGVEMVLSGHEHNYQRFEVGGVEYVVSGGGGAGLYALKDCASGHPPRIAGDMVHQFLAISQSQAGLHVQVVASDGSIVDTFDVAW